jgi:hypothetical protein
MERAAGRGLAWFGLLWVDRVSGVGVDGGDRTGGAGAGSFEDRLVAAGAEDGGSLVSGPCISGI